MRRRKSIVVHGRTYRIKRVAQRTIDKDHPTAKPGSVLADCDSPLGEIRVVRGLAFDTEERLIEHEATHAAIWELSLGHKFNAADPTGELEEDVCNLIVPCVRAAMV